METDVRVGVGMVVVGGGEGQDGCTSSEAKLRSGAKVML